MPHNADYLLWLEMVRRIPLWEFATAGFSIFFGLAVFVFYDLVWIHKLGLFHSFESIKFKKREIDKAFSDSTYIEISYQLDLIVLQDQEF